MLCTTTGVFGTPEIDVGSQVVGIIYDSLMYFAATVANHIKIPRLVLISSSPGFDQTFVAIPRPLAEGSFPFQGKWHLLDYNVIVKHYLMVPTSH